MRWPVIQQKGRPQDYFVHKGGFPCIIEVGRNPSKTLFVRVLRRVLRTMWVGGLALMIGSITNVHLGKKRGPYRHLLKEPRHIFEDLLCLLLFKFS